MKHQCIFIQQMIDPHLLKNMEIYDKNNPEHQVLTSKYVYTQVPDHLESLEDCVFYNKL